MLPEYDFSEGVRGKYAKKYAEGTKFMLIKKHERAIQTWEAKIQKHPQVLDVAQRRIRALNHPLRQKILTLIKENGNWMNVKDIYTKLSIEQSVASQHLAILRNQELVETERDGKTIWYSVNDAAIDILIEACNMAGSNPEPAIL